MQREGEGVVHGRSVAAVGPLARKAAAARETGEAWMIEVPGDPMGRVAGRVTFGPQRRKHMRIANRSGSWTLVVVGPLVANGVDGGGGHTGMDSLAGSSGVVIGGSTRSHSHSLRSGHSAVV